MISMGYNSLILLYFWQEIIQLTFCFISIFSWGEGGLAGLTWLETLQTTLFFSGKLDFQPNENDRLSLSIIKGRWKSINFTSLNGNCIFFFFSISVKFKEDLMFNLVFPAESCLCGVNCMVSINFSCFSNSCLC